MYCGSISGELVTQAFGKVMSGNEGSLIQV